MKRKSVYSKKRKKTGFFSKHSPIDKTLLILIFSILIFGLVMIYDATIILAQDIYQSPYRFVLLQLIWITVGLLGFYFFSVVNLEHLRKVSKYFFYITIFFLVVLALFGLKSCENDILFAPCLNGANRWFYFNPPPLPQFPIMGSLGFQPSELAKFVLVLFLADILADSVTNKNRPFTKYLGVTGLVSFLILMQPNMSTAALIFITGTIMYFSSGAKLKPLLISIPVFGFLGAVLMMSSSYRRQRLITFITQGIGSDLSTGYHIKQIQIALGSGGFFGIGLGQSRQKFQYLPEVFADSIFAIIGEELGFLGTSIIILLFFALLYKGYDIAKNTNDLYYKLLAVGVTSWLGIQFFVNVAAMTKIIPLTGIPLPLVSYGGSSLIFILAGLGVLANISRKSIK